MVKLMSSAKGNAMLSKGSSPPKNKYKLIGSPKTDKNGEKCKEIHKIYTLRKADWMPYGWTFLVLKSESRACLTVKEGPLLWVTKNLNRSLI